MSAIADYADYWDLATQNEDVAQYSRRVQGPGAHTVQTTTYASAARCAARKQLHLTSTPLVFATYSAHGVIASVRWSV